MGRNHAVVIGGSFSGLAAARVLSESFDQVTVLDRDRFPEGAGDRPGIPQARHVHGLLVRGLREYEQLFPGFEQLAVERGATFHDHTHDFVVLRPNGWQPRYRSDLKFLSASRELIESCVRDLFKGLPKVELRQQTPAIGVAVKQVSAPRCVGVVVPVGKGRETIEADLTVDASGSVSRAPQWFESVGLAAPDETTVDPLAGYSSRWFQGPSGDAWPSEWWWWAGAYIRRRPDDLVEANFQLKEHNRWHLTLSGFNRHYPPTREDEFMAILPQFRSPIIAEMVRLMKPISPVYANRAIRNRWRHYEQWSERLDAFIAIGDAFVTYNPVYAQGMTASALSATVLRECLAKYDPVDPEFPRAFFEAEATIQRDPWMLSAGVDLRFPFTMGSRPLPIRLMNMYMEGIGLAARRNPKVRRTLVEVAQLIRPLSDLLQPSIIASVAVWSGFAGLRSLRSLVSEVTPTAISRMPPTYGRQPPRHTAAA
jgi:2-polyprenyl-6-methoxyphenol hydroxylase-like FAD-dependent oxidoreductase